MNRPITSGRIPGIAVLRLGILSVLLTLAAHSARAQSPTDNGTPLGMAPGSPEGSYALSGFEDVNLYNGGLSFSFPLLRIGGRGSAGYTMQLPIDSKWSVFQNEWYDENENLLTSLVPNSTAGYVQYPNYGPGWVSIRQAVWQPYACNVGWVNVTAYRWAVATVVFSAPDGTEHELVDQSTLGQPTYYPSYCTYTGNSRGTVFKSRDGSGITYISDSAIIDFGNIGGLPVAGYLKMPDGTVYRFDATNHVFTGWSYYTTKLSWVRDANGNKTTFSYTTDDYGEHLTTVTDSVNRQVTIEYNVTQSPYGLCDRLTYKGSGGSNRVIHISKGNLDTALRSGFSIQTFHQLFPELDGADDAFDPMMVITGIWLPDSDGVTRRYRFLYNNYGELARVELPTGGAIEYDWASGLSNGAADGLIYAVPGAASYEVPGIPQIYRRLLTRRVLDVGNVGVGSTTYSRPESQNGNNSITNLGFVSVSHRDANNQQLSLDNHYFYGSPAISFFSWDTTPGSMPTYSPFGAYRDGREYQTDLYAANGQTLLRRETKAWDQPNVSWWSGSADTAPSNGAFVKETVTTLSDSGQVTKTTNINPQNGQIMIDQFGNPTDTWIYDYGQGAPGGLLRHMHTEFMTVNPVNNVDYTNRTSVSSPHKLSLPTRMSIYDATETERARTTMEYDNYTTADNFHAALKDWSSVYGYAYSGLDANFGTSYTTRGNTTKSTRYFLDGSGNVTGSINGYVQYDIAGSVFKSLDARSTSGNLIATTFDFNDCFGAPDGDLSTNTSPTWLSSVNQRSYAYATSSTTPAGQTNYTQFDYYLGNPVDSKDTNGTISSGYYEDALDRPTKLIKAINRDVSFPNRMLFTYDDAGRNSTTTADQYSYSDGLLKSQSFYDGLGRTIETRSFETATKYIAVQQHYDAQGRVYQVSNPFRPLAPDNETAVWTTTVFDALSRVISVTTPDNAVATTSYSGNSVTGTEATGKKRKIVNDGLGRLVQAYEDPTGVNWLTSYTYDGLDKLIGVSQYDSVSQTTQTRTFTYDSLKRLTSATNAEKGTINSTYDEKGNLLVQTDARGVSKHFSYDMLNRLTRRWYNGSGSTGSTTNNSPALPSGVAASDEVNFIYDGQTLPSGAPASFNRGYSTGRLVAVTYGTGSSAGDYFSYDAVGRLQTKIQQTGGINYQTSANYNNGGELTAETYPSGRTVSYSYDQAGRTSSVSGTLGDGSSRTYSSGIIYSSLGGLSKEQFGTDTAVYNKLFYNVRGQLSEIRDSTSYTGAGDTSWNRGALINHYSGNCWGMCAGQNMTDNNGTVKKQDYYIPDNDQVSNYHVSTDWFTYDAVNRLQQATETNYISSTNQSATPLQQAYTIDRFGNRTINQGSTWGGVNNQAFSVNPANNRLGVPNGQSGTMTYDAAGNLTNDTYSGQGQRNYDAENRMTQAWSGGQWQTYAYDAGGQRVRRIANGNAIWQVYGLGGELVAEYPAGAAAASAPLKEYGYRNGQILVTAEPVNLALNKTATESTTFVSGTEATKAVDDNTDGALWHGHASATNYGANAWWQVDLGSVQSVGAIQVFGRTDCCPEMTSAFYVFVSDNAFTSTDLNTTLNQSGVSNYYVSGFSGTPGTINANRTGRYIRVQFAGSQYLVLGEVKVLRNTAEVNWLVTDQLGTPRMIFDKTGSLANTKRHDYLPFGEELTTQGLRTTQLGYTADNLRQKFTSYEHDNETGLDYAHARYYANFQGRFTGVDSVSGSTADPQSWNGYTYTQNNPVNLTDPTGQFAGAEYGSDPFRSSDPYIDYARLRALWDDDLGRAMAVYQQMVDEGFERLRLKEQQEKAEKEKLAKDSVSVKVGDQLIVITVQQANEVAGFPYEYEKKTRVGIGVKLTVSITDENGKAIEGTTAVEVVKALQGDPIRQTPHDVPLDSQGRGTDYVTNSAEEPKSRADYLAIVAQMKKDFITKQEFNLTVNLKNGAVIQVTLIRTLTNLTAGKLNSEDRQLGFGPGVPAYTYTQEKLKASVVKQ